MNNEDQDMTIDRLELLIQRELDGEILPEEEAELQQALGQDHELRAIYDANRRFSSLLAEDREQITAPASLATSISDRILAEEGTTSAPESIDFYRYLKPVAVAAALLLMVSAGFLAGRSSVQADLPTSRAGLLAKKQVIIDEHPELDRSEIDALFDRCLRQLEEIAADRRQRDNAAFLELETGAEKLIRKAKVKAVESK